MFNRQKLQPGNAYIRDASSMTGKATHIMPPLEEQELREAVRYSNNRGHKVTISGMRTGLCGGAVPQGGEVISLEYMSGVTGVGKDDKGYFLRVLPCTTINQINELLRSRSFEGLQDVTPGAMEMLKGEPDVYFYPVDPTEMDSSIGGNINTNASGPRTYKYGPTRDWVKGFRIVFADGTFEHIDRGDYMADGRRMSFPCGRNYYSFELPGYDSVTGVKDAVGPRISEGMDLVDLIIGSEGIFGIVTEADIRIIPSHPLVSGMLFFPTDDDALAFVKEMKADPTIDPEFIEFMDVRSLDLIRKLTENDPGQLRIPILPSGSAVFFDMSTDDLDARMSVVGAIAERHGSSLDDSWCAKEYEDRQRMRELRHAIPKAINDYVASLVKEMPKIHKMGTDMSVPDGRLDEMMACYREHLSGSGLDYCMFGHIGNNHLHVNIILKTMDDLEKAKAIYRVFAAKAIELGGSPSAEHGIGKLKTEYLPMMYGEKAVEDLRRIKSVLDPNWTLNNGNLVG